ncbi:MULTISPECIES: AAA family ATPase [Vibrio]|nr:AAA family ATPase [Vibrio sp. 705]MBS9836157.1 AAA family ATPase [Vibrio alginolyticus]MBY4646650.1 AAA family ATPase [Vibrio alginolyticus]MDW1907182.1 AAA family ATPase [Vibrio sp. 705]
MSDSITIKGVTSYHPTTPQIIDISKQNTLIFGLNGAGKSTISNFLYDREKFDSCSLNVEGSFTPIVYNQAFVEQHFVKSSMQEGVFTLSKDNADLEARIAEKSKLREKLLELYNGIKAKISEAETAQGKATDSAIEEVFKQKNIIEKTSLAPFLEGFKRPKSNFYKQVKSQKGVSQDSIESLQAEYDSLTQSDKALPTLIELPSPPSLSIEETTILSEPIVGSSSSQLTEFITELNNQNWVKNGKDSYLAEEQTKCPFCQKDTIDDTFRSELAALFDKTYNSNVQKVEAISKSYGDAVTNYITSIQAAFINCSLYDPNLHKVDPVIALLERVYQDNLDLIKSKIEKPSLSIEIIDYQEKSAPLMSISEEINAAVKVIIIKARKFKESKKDIQDRMWDSVRYHTESIFSLEKRLIDEKDSDIKQLNADLKRVKQVGQKVASRISYLRSKTSNIDDTIERININLKSLGLTSFEIVSSTDPEQQNYFVLSRGEKTNEGKEVFKSLSEGEKTLITFLYFIEKCNGSMSKDSDIADKEKLIVIDDPISSLSQNYIYDIASLTHTKIIKGNKFKKVIVLTHSLFFYQELLKLAPQGKDRKGNDRFNDKYSLYRLNKKQYTNVQPMNKGELKNDYQSLWQIIKDVIEGSANPVVLPNVMRNIIEYYFGFVHKRDKLSDILNELAEKEPEQGHKAFYRYINRSSHSDPTNIGLMVEVEPQAYLERFKSIFIESQDEEHYHCMMES